MAVRILNVSVTPNETTVGQPIRVIVSAQEIDWNNLKTDFTDWGEVRRSFNNWNKVMNYVYTNVNPTPDSPTYTVDAISGASYGFSLNGSGYYESGNKGVNSSYAICRINFKIPVATTVYFDCINYAESNYDYGIIGNIDTALTLSSSVDSSYAKSFKGSSSSAVQTVTLAMSSGTHFVDVKFIKDVSASRNNDTLQFKVRFE